MRLEKDNVPLHHWQSTVQCFIYITIFFIFDFSVQPCQSIVPVAMNIVFFFFSVVVVFFFSSGTTSHKWLQFSLQFFFSLPLLLGTHWFWSWPICCCLFAAASVELLSNKFTFNIFLVYSRTKKKKITEIDSATWHFVPLYFGLWRYILSYVVYSLTVIQQNEYGRDIWIWNTIINNNIEDEERKILCIMPGHCQLISRRCICVCMFCSSQSQSQIELDKWRCGRECRHRMVPFNFCSFQSFFLQPFCVHRILAKNEKHNACNARCVFCVHLGRCV